MEEKITGKRFLAVTLLSVLITIVEIIGGLVSVVWLCCLMPFTTWEIPSRLFSATLLNTSVAVPKPGSELMVTGGRRFSRPSLTTSC